MEKQPLCLSMLNKELNDEESPETILKQVQYMVQDKFTTDDDSSNWFVHQFPTKSLA